MPEGVATAPVVATPGNPAEGGQNQNDNGLPFKTPNAGKKQFASRAEETLFRINDPTAEETSEVADMNAAIDKGVADAAKGSKLANSNPEKVQPPPNPGEEEKKLTAKEKLKVKFGDKEEEYELDEEQKRRFAQKGIYYEKKNAEITKRDRSVAAREAAATAKEAEAASMIEALKQGGLDLLIEIHGKEKVREMTEGFLRPEIEREMMPEADRKQLEWQERAERAEQQLQQREQQEHQTKVSAQEKQHVDNYNKVIIEALEMGGVPKTNFTAAEMADHMLRGLQNNIEYTPQQLADFVRQDNMVRIGALTERQVDAITNARKSNDTAGIVKAGEALMQMLGEPVMHAIGVYYIHRAKSGKPQQGAQQVLDTPKVKPKEEALKRKSQYMSEDEAREERMRRVALMEQGIDPGEWK
jgi:hypothetical protein